jgi:hypothetical protein
MQRFSNVLPRLDHVLQHDALLVIAGVLRHVLALLRFGSRLLCGQAIRNGNISHHGLTVPDQLQTYSHDRMRQVRANGVPYTIAYPSQQGLQHSWRARALKGPECA